MGIWDHPDDPGATEPDASLARNGIARIVYPLTASRLDSQAPGWADQVQSLRTVLGAPHNPNLLPPQFVFATLQEIGGDVVQWHRGTRLAAAGTRLTSLDAVGTRQHLICYHRTPESLAAGLTQADLARAANTLFPDAPVHLYEGAGTHTWEDPAIQETIEGVQYGAPRMADADAVRQLQSTIWHAEETNLYPTYLHDPAFGAVYSLVARQADQVLGFLMGFLHAGPPGSPFPAAAATPGTLRLESLILGVHPDHRSRQIAFHLKRIQAAQTRALGIDLIQWVVDPLQYRNARLNLGRLGAVSGQFLRDYLPFRNALNQVHASRVRLVWPLHAPHVQQALQGTRHPSLDLHALPEAGVTNEGLDRVRLHLDRDWLAMEIPANWDRVQRTSVAQAQQWRDMTDEILGHYLGSEPGRYLFTHTGYRDAKVYLVAQRASPDVMARYTSSAITPRR